MAETAVADGLSASAALAARHGLGVAGEPPRLTKYASQLWKYRHFIHSYSDAKLESQFSTTKFGRYWQVLTPLTNVLVYFLIFGYVFDSPTRPQPYIAFLSIGIFIFAFTQSAVSSGLLSISSNLAMIRALHFPRACLPLSTTMMQMQNLIASMVVLAAIVLISGVPISWNWLLVIPALALQTIFNAGLAMFMARLGSKMHDLKQVMPFILRTWMYGSAVLYEPARIVSVHYVGPLMRFNPLMVFIELIRHALVPNMKVHDKAGHVLAHQEPLSSPIGQLWLIALGWALVIGVGGFIYFWRGEKEYGRG